MWRRTPFIREPANLTKLEMTTHPDQVSEKSAETLDSLLAHHVAGGLPMPVDLLVRSHLEIRADSRLMVDRLESLAGNALEAIEPAQLADRDTMLERITGGSLHSAGPGPTAQDRTCAIMPRALRDFTGYTAEDIPWRTKLPGFRDCRLGEIEGCEAELLWIRAGRAMPSHTHGGTELTLVLEGGFSDGDGHYIRGDICAADESVDHRPVADEDGPCICLAVTTAPLKLTGSMRQLFSDIFGR